MKLNGPFNWKDYFTSCLIPKEEYFILQQSIQFLLEEQEERDCFVNLLVVEVSTTS